MKTEDVGILGGDLVRLDTWFGDVASEVLLVQPGGSLALICRYSKDGQERWTELVHVSLLSWTARAGTWKPDTLSADFGVTVAHLADRKVHLPLPTVLWPTRLSSTSLPLRREKLALANARRCAEMLID